MPPVFLLWPRRASSARAPRRARQHVLSGLAALVVAASLVSGGAAFVSDIGIAFRFAGPSIFTPGDRAQIDAVRTATPPGEPILLVVTRDAVWTSYLWQRALYPDRPVVVLQAPLRPESLAEARRRYGFRTGVSIGDPPPDPGFRASRDLGPIAGLPGRVRFGALSP